MSWLNNSPVASAFQLVVGVNATQLAPPQAGITVDELTLLADDANTGLIYIGGSNVSITTGFKLKSDHGLGGIHVSSLDVIWAVADGAGQILWVFYTLPMGDQY